MLSRRKFIKLAAPALILPSVPRIARAGFSIAQTSNQVPGSYPVGLDATKTFFVDQFGAPCLAIGDDASDLWEMVTSAQIDQYMIARRQLGYNLLWVTCVDNLVQSNPEANLAGNFPFSSAKSFTGMSGQMAYWNLLAYAFQSAAKQGISLALMPAFIGLSPTQGYYSSYYGLSSATRQAYLSFLVGLIGNFKNRMWLLGGDADPNNAASYAAMTADGAYLKSIDPNTIITFEACRFLENTNPVPGGGYSSADAAAIAFGSTPSWLDLNWIYKTQATVLAGAQAGYPQGLPCIGGEFGYALETSAGVTMTSVLVRGQGYLSILGGCTTGTIGGNGAIWSFNAPNGSPCCTSGTPSWQSQLTSTASGSGSYQLMSNLFRSRSWQKLVPDRTNVVMTSSTGAAGTVDCARTSDGLSIIAYAQAQMSMTFDMSKITDAGNQAIARWFDPTTGAVRNAGTFTNSGSQIFPTPGVNGAGDPDWVLVIDSVAANFRPPGT